MNMSIAQTDAPGNKPERSDFLRALYHGAPEELYFELRCIHPTSGDARSFWSRVGDKRTLTNALNRGTALNRESGYGLYFAPCLRSQKQGKAEAAALLPALWVDLDCDDDAVRRAAALTKLHTFNPLPSAIIDSGGGLHAYWLLTEPASLIDEAARKQAAGILRGLFSALGGDPQYVKSVASVMRLPNSLNTKPERGGVIVTLIELYPDRRYLLSDFALVQRFFPQAAMRPALHLVGTTGSGKSEIAALMTSFYGEFTRDTPPAQWGDTVNMVEVLGYALADALYWVDDYKTCYADERTFTRFLHAYSRGMGRGRLTREAKLRQERPCRGLLLSTGETTIEGEASILSRMLVLEVPPWEKRDPDGQALVQAERLREHLPGFTAHFASWIAKQLEQGDLKTDIANRFNSNMRGYREKLANETGGQSNTGRVIQNWAVLVTVYQMLSRFLYERDKEYLIPAWQDAIVESVRTLRQERASEVFLDILGQLIAGGQAVIDDDMKNPREYPPGVTVVGYKDEGFVYLLPEIAHREVNRVQPLRFTVTAIGMQLREDNILIPGPNNLSTQKRVRGGRVRFWQLTSEFFVEPVEPPETEGR
jgi:hypothetical protein